ncbi:MAG TPA: FHA domain-containing protein [Polyangiaceae bacterium]|nr:FHA domain-containing protein [Polyangiaceae bacterium]
MSVVCPQCGTPAKGTDKFCNSCGFLLQQPGAPPPQPFGGPPRAPPPQQGPYGYGAPQPPMQQPPMQQPYGQPQGYPPPQAPMDQGGFPPPQQPFGAPPPGYGQQQPPPFGAPPPQQPPPPPFGAPQQQAPSPFGAPPAPYGAPPAPYGHSPSAVCAQGHEIPPGASYCPMGHPIAVQGPPQDAYQGQGFAPQQQQQQPPPPFGGAPPPPFGGPPPPPQPFGGAPAAPALAPTETPPPPQPGPQAIRGFIISFQTNQNGDFWPLKGGRVIVGRAQSVDGLDIALPDATISSRHATLHVDGVQGTVAVEDTGSTNGTYVNEEHIGLNGRRDLHDGDKVRFGGYTTIVKIVSRI